jgi:uncharacterized protein (TIGR02266 family)
MMRAPVDAIGHDTEAQLARTEQDVGRKEQEVLAEKERLDGTAGGLLARLQQARAAAAKLHASGVVEPAFRELVRRAEQAGVPGLALEAIRKRAADARRAALEARHRAVEELRQAMQTHASSLSRLASQLTADEAELGRYESLARAKASAPRAVPPPPPAEALAPAGLRPADRRPNGRRETPRVRMQAAVDFGSDTNFFTGFSTNISEGGLFIATVQVLELGTPVDLQFSLPSGERLAVHGVVRWTREINDQTPDIFPGIGVQFTNVPESTHELLKTFVATREPMFYPD